MLKSTRKFFSLLFAAVMFLSIISVNAQDKKEEKSKKKYRLEFAVPVPPVPPVPPAPVVSPVPPVPPIPPVQPHLPSLPSLPELPEMPELPAMPELPELPELPDFSDFGSISINGNRSMYFKDSGLSFESEGRVRFSEDYSSIESITENGYLIVKNRETRQEVYIERDAESDEVVFSYYKRGRLLPFKGEGEEWLKSVWDQLVEVYK